jgi:glycosyltransferase involved in cell wall biosynthesis
MLRLVANYLSFVLSGTWGALFRLRGDFDAIVVFGVSPATAAIPAMVARRRFRAPMLYWVLDLWPESIAAAGAVRTRWILGLVGMMVRQIYKACARVLIASRAFSSNVRRYGACPDRVRYFPNWVEEEYQVAGGGETCGMPEGFVIVFAGNLGVAQDLPAVLEAACETLDLRDVHWVFAGDGRMAQWARDQAESRGLAGRVHFLGQLPPDRMPALLGGADALLVSLRPDPIFATTVPGKVQSYLASGRPILAMLDGEGARLVEEAGAGLTCRGGDALGLAGQVRTLRAMPPEVRLAMGDAGRAYAKRHFDREVLFDRLVAWIDEARREEPCRTPI